MDPDGGRGSWVTGLIAVKDRDNQGMFDTSNPPSDCQRSIHEVFKAQGHLVEIRYFDQAWLFHFNRGSRAPVIVYSS